MGKKKYMITKQHCQKMIDESMPIICTCCGGKIEPIKTVDNADNPTYWQGCKKCMRFDSGTSSKIYNTAVKMVDEFHFMAYHFNEMPDIESKRR
jgi:hypothetical protein